MHKDSSEKQAFWRSKLQEYRQSGLGRREFCKRHRLKTTTMDYWFRRLGKPGGSQGLVELKVATLQAPMGVLEVLVAGRYRVAVHHGFDSQLLGEVVKALETLA